MKHTLRISLCWLIAFSFSISVFGQEVSEMDIYDLIMSRIQEKQKSTADILAIDNDVASLLARLNPDGSFSDLNYAETNQTNWRPMTHLDRMKSFVLAYTTEGSSYFENEDTFDKIEALFSYWQEKDPRSTNWYMQQIGAPQRMGILLILMRKGNEKLSTQLENSIIQRMASIGGAPDQGGSQGTGANKVDIATHWVYRGCLTKNRTVLEKGIQQVFYPLFHTTGEGFQHDYSYLQHGQQLYIGGYGDVIAQGICNVAQYVNGTDYELSEEKFDILFNFMRKTYLPVIRGKYFLYNAAGRSLSRPNAMNKSGFGETLELLKAVDGNNMAEYDNATKRVTGEENASFGINPYHAHYWRSDYSLHQRPGFTFDVRMVSTRTLRNENGNNENIKGYFLSEGATDIAVDGDEYYNIFPVWDWGRIPGTTSPALTSIPKPAQWGTAGTSSFVGGVSDGKYGISTFALNNIEHNINTQAKKSWFFFDDEVVCLGAGIESTNATQVNTTLDQAHLKGDVTIIKTDNSSDVFTTSQKGSRSYTDASWVLHNKVGYYLPEAGSIVVNNQSQSGSWYSINQNDGYSTATQNLDVFKLWFNHGVKPTDGSYAYFIVPNVNTPAKVAAYNADNIEILANTSSVQAVKNVALGITSVIFYEPGTFTYADRTTVSVSEACAVMFKNIETDRVDVHISDPSCSKENITLIFENALLGKKELVCPLNTETAYAGSTHPFVIDENTLDYVHVPVESVSVADELTMTTASATLTATVFPENARVQTVQWSSSNENVVKVVGDGILLAYGSGEATITVTTDEGGFQDECKVTVENLVSSVALADSYVRGGSYASANYGSESLVVVKKDESVGYDRHGFFKFSIADLDNINLEGNNLNVEAHLYIQSTGETANTANLLVYAAANTNWTDANLTYSNKPANGTLLQSTPGFVVTESDFDLDNVLIVDLSDYALAEYQKGNKLIAFQVFQNRRGDSGKGMVNIASKEHGEELKHPRIIIQHSGKVGFENPETTSDRAQVYPTVTTGPIGVIVDQIQPICIYSLSGTLMQCIHPERVGKNSLDIGFLNAGMYIVKVGTKSCPIIKK